jgi:hypothetical protein
MDALCSYCHAIYDWTHLSNLALLNEMRVRTAQDLNDKLQTVANPPTDEATDIEMGDIEYTESLRKRVSELNLEILLYTSKAAPSFPPLYPDLKVKWPTWHQRSRTTNEYKVDFGIWKGKRIHDMSHNCVQCRLVKTLMKKNEEVLGNLLSAEVEVSLILDAFTLKPKEVLLLLQTSDHEGRVWEEIKLLRHQGEFCSTRRAISHRYDLQTSASSHSLESSFFFFLGTLMTFSRYGVTANRDCTPDRFIVSKRLVSTFKLFDPVFKSAYSM